MISGEPPPDCRLCPRLVAFRQENQRQFPGWHNAPAPSFGDQEGRLLIIGLAPGLRGANRTGRPFTGDYAGRLLHETLLAYGFASGVYDQRPDDGLRLTDCRITNAVRCVPPANKPDPIEITTCRPFLVRNITEMPRLRAVIVLGRIAHDSALRAFGHKLSGFPFGHGAIHGLSPRIKLFDSYHCSRYNTNTGQLTTEMFRSVFAAVRNYLDDSVAVTEDLHQPLTRVTI
jgi:uracil-DNA glycosylase family 4